MSTRDTQILEEAKSIFAKYLEDNGLRKTPERFAIMDEIYSRDDHFEAEALFIDLKGKEFNVSRATVYNTLDLLNSCDLVKKHQFGKNHAQYEKAYARKQHDHLICEKCEEVIEFCDPRIQQIQNMMGEIFDFKINHHSLVLYGNCNNNDCKNLKNK